MLVGTKLSNIAVNDIDTKKSARYSLVLLVRDLAFKRHRSCTYLLSGPVRTRLGMPPARYNILMMFSILLLGGLFIARFRGVRTSMVSLGFTLQPVLIRYSTISMLPKTNVKGFILLGRLESEFFIK